MRRLVSLVVATVTGLALLVLVAPAAFAQAANDDFANATVIDSVPFSTTEDTSQATSDPGDPPGCSTNGSVWFAYTPPSDMTIRAGTSGSNYFTSLSAWTGTQGALSSVACDGFSFPSQIHFQVTGGTTYYFMVAFCCGGGQNGGGDLHLSVSQLLPPANDNFADAVPITALPFARTADLLGATTEASEPTSCAGQQLQGTAWYSFTPTTTESLSASVDQFDASFAVYTGTSLTDLTAVTCNSFGNQPRAFRAEAGTTFYIQVGGLCCGESGPVTFHLQVAPDPVASMFLFPSDPSAFDIVQFEDNSFDPAGGQFVSLAWSFGDGATATGCCPNHQYAQDGDYTVGLTVTTDDGRTASTSRVVQVRTHDVAVVEVAVPNSAHVGQTVAINVRVRNNRYPDTVRVELSRSVPGGFQEVGSLVQLVPVRPPGGNSTRFAFTYTITPADGTIGKVSFSAVATIVDHHDALSGDNELLSPPVKIT